MSVIKPISIIGYEDDGLMRRLNFCDSDGEEYAVEDLNSSSEFISPEKCLVSTPLMKRKDSSVVSEEEGMNSSTDSFFSLSIVRSAYRNNRMTTVNNSMDTTPPYRKVRALKLFESPKSPKSILKQSRNPNTKRTQPHIFTPKSGTYDKNHNSVSRCRPVFTFYKNQSSPVLESNVNPFYKSELSPISQGKRRRDSGLGRSQFNYSSDGYDIDANLQPAKRIHLREGCLSRYETEFEELGQIGSGEFGSVFKCTNRLDGCMYAIKKSRKPLKGTSDERTALNEVYAHAVLGHHQHVVRYYSAWAENDHMLIQNEYCNGGSLAEVIEDKQKSTIPEADVKRILLHIALGLRYIHSLNLAHMDIKPGNIFITRNRRLLPSPNSEDDGEFLEDETIYKIGDLGHVTLLSNPEVEEGDCRYMPAELLQDVHRHLPKADIFALGLTIYEVCGGGPLPKNGPEWHALREGYFSDFPCYSKELNSLIRELLNPNPTLRPSSAALVQNQTLVPYVCKTKEQLNHELTIEKIKNEMLCKQLKAAAKSLEKEHKYNPLRRIIGGKINRSRSVTNF